MRWKRLIHFKLRAFLQIQLCCSTRGDVMVKFARHAKDMYVELWKRAPFCNMCLDDKKSFSNLSDSILHWVVVILPHCFTHSLLKSLVTFIIFQFAGFKGTGKSPEIRYEIYFQLIFLGVTCNICFSMMRSADSKVQNLGKFTNENNHRSC